MLNPKPTDSKRPTKKLLVKCNKKVAQVIRELWPFTLQESTLPTELAGHTANELCSPLFKKEYINTASQKIPKMCTIFP